MKWLAPLLGFIKAVGGYLAAFLFGSERQKRKQAEDENEQLREGQDRWGNRPSSLDDLVERLRDDD